MRLTCVNIVSGNPKRLADFYETILGADIDESHGGPHRIEIGFGEKREGSTEDMAVLIVVNYDEGFIPQKSNACQGFEFHVSDVDAEYKRMRALGVEMNESPKNLPWGYRYFNMKDPDGNGVDIVQAL